MTATTALTAQNTLGVNDVHITPPSFLEKQLRAVLDDIPVNVIKMGMLASADTISTIARTVNDYRSKGQEFHIVLDPVMVSTSGAQLLPGDAVRNLRQLLLPSTFILTPNVPEATLLLRDADVQYKSPSCLDDLKDLAKQVSSLGPQHVLLKGGHMPLNKHRYAKANPNDKDSDKVVIDILYSADGGVECIEQPFLSSPNTHGTGCSLASAIAANYAIYTSTHPTTSSSANLVHIMKRAITYVTHGIRTSASLALEAKGSGPINHFHSISTNLFPPNSFIDYLLSHPRITPIWDKYVYHPFVTALADGSLPEEHFKNYMVQDYLYLTHFARTNALAGYKAQSITETVRSAEIILLIRKEMELHLGFCKEFGLSPEEIENTPESQACVAYSRYVLDVGMSNDLLSLYVALAPCLIGYGEAASRIHGEHTKCKAEGKESKWKDASQGNKYWKWIENYVEADYQEAVVKGRDLIEDMVEKQGFRAAKGKVGELVQVFRRATEMEVRFWELDAHSSS